MQLKNKYSKTFLTDAYKDFISHNALMNAFNSILIPDNPNIYN